VRVLLVGGGGREHALAWALARSRSVDELAVAPGNPGIAEVARCLPIGVADIDGLVEAAVAMAADLVVIGPEGPLVAGLADRLRERGIGVFGPSAAAARLEGSKGFLKDLCARHGIPTAAYRRFTDADEAGGYVRAHGAPVVVKVDGLAAGKGVVVAMTVDEAIAAVDEALRALRFGEAGQSVVVEDFLVGPEMSFFALSDGLSASFFATAMDYKRLGDGGVGPNTGGMGAITPHPMQTPELVEQVMETIIRPTVAAMRSEGAPFRGVLYAGLMLTERGPMLLEYNVRFGDPECEALMVALDDDLGEILREASGDEAQASPRAPRWHRGAVACVVMAAPGYPESPVTGGEISGVGDAVGEATWVFHAGTRRDELGALRTAGGRVLDVVARDASLEEAARRAYAAVAKIRWPGEQHRSDVGTWGQP
jgi:phosphoribosylamine--glycine ligase